MAERIISGDVFEKASFERFLPSGDAEFLLFFISRVREFLPFLFANRFLRRGKVLCEDELRRVFFGHARSSMSYNGSLSFYTE